MESREIAWNIAHGLVWSAQRYPDKIALRDRGRAVDYRTLNGRVNRLAHALTGLGLGPGDRLMLLLGDRGEHLEALFAAAKIGVVAAPVDHRWGEDEIRHAVDLFDPHGVIFEDATRPVAPAIPGPRIDFEREYESLLSRADDGEAIVPVEADAAFCIGCTSGTTGLPKGIVLSHRSLLWRIPIYAFDLGIGPEDRWLSVTPMAQGGGRAFAMATLIRGGCVVVVPKFDADRVLATIAGEGITVAFMVPTMLRRLAAFPGAADADTSSLRCLISSGSALRGDVRDQVAEAVTDNLYQFYSSTESGGLTLLPPWLQAEKAESVGTPVFGKEVIVDEAGEVLTRGPALMEGYFRNPEATAAAFRDGWFRTGDIGWFDDDGILFLTGRSKDIIITGGANVYPAEVERVLVKHPAVQDAAVVGVPDPDWGEAVIAYVELGRGGVASAEELIEHCRSHMASYKKPKTITFVDALPRTTMGKVAKQKLPLSQRGEGEK